MSLAIFMAFFLLTLSIVVPGNSTLVANAQRTPDDDGAMMYDYHGVQRKVYNPTVLAGSGINYYNEFKATGDKEAKENLLNSAEWLVKNADDKGNYSLWTYEFPWKSYGWVAPPYHSALAQAEGINVLIMAHRITNDSKYLDSAKKAFNSFFVD